MGKVPKKIFLVWQGEDNSEDDNYFNEYHSLDDAVSSEHGEWEDGEVEVYEATPKLLGMYKAKSIVVKSRRK